MLVVITSKKSVFVHNKFNWAITKTSEVKAKQSYQ